MATGRSKGLPDPLAWVRRTGVIHPVDPRRGTLAEHRVMLAERPLPGGVRRGRDGEPRELIAPRLSGRRLPGSTMHIDADYRPRLWRTRWPQSGYSIYEVSADSGVHVRNGRDLAIVWTEQAYRLEISTWSGEPGSADLASLRATKDRAPTGRVAVVVIASAGRSYLPPAPGAPYCFGSDGT